jgi:hypothetical protein
MQAAGSRSRLLRASGPAIAVVAVVWSVYQAFWNIGAANLNADEPVYLTAGWAYVHGDFSVNREHPPTAKYIIGFAQLIFGQGELAGRIAVAVSVIAGGVILYFWLRREIGWAGALFATLAWTLLPHGVSSGVRIDRFALLEPFMVFFAIAAFAAAWRWFRTRSWLWLCVSAIAMALSVTSKVSTAVMIPAILILPLLEKRVRDALLGALVFIGVFCVVFVLVYLPMGIRSAIVYMLQFQAEHNADGHLVVVAGVATTNPPWWANLLFSVEGIGIAATVVLLGGTIAAFWRRPAALTIYLTVGIGLLWAFYLVFSSVALPHYYYVWVWLFCALAGIGLSVLIRAKRTPRRTLITRILAAAMIALALVCAIWTSVAIANERAMGMALVVPTLDERGVDQGEILVSGMAGWEFSPYLEHRETTDLANPDIVAIAMKDSERFPEAPELKALLEAHADEYDRVVLDDVTLYIARDAESNG